MVKIQLAWTVVAGGFFGTSAWKKRTMQQSHLHFSGVIGNGDRKQTGILVVHMHEIDAAIRRKVRQSDPLPMEKIGRNGQRDPWADERKRGVRHHIALQRFDECNARILTATAAVRAPFVPGFRLECDAEPFYSARIACLIESHSGNSDARIVAPAFQPWKEIEMTVGPPGGRRI